MSFDRLIRFVDENGKQRYGNLEHPHGAKEIEGSEVQLLGGDLQGGFHKSSERATVKKVMFHGPN